MTLSVAQTYSQCSYAILQTVVVPRSEDLPQRDGRGESPLHPLDLCQQPVHLQSNSSQAALIIIANATAIILSMQKE